jgi:hypothetical protein
VTKLRVVLKIPPFAMVSPGRGQLACSGWQSPLRPPASPPVVLEDLLQGLNEWRNIQDIVRVTFKAFHDVLRAQGEAIQTLERVMDTKCSRTEVATALASKASAEELVCKMDFLERHLGEHLATWVCTSSFGLSQSTLPK